MKRMRVNVGMWLIAFLCLATQSLAQTQNITVDVAGTLESKLGENKATTEELIVSGSLNGADIKCIRQMLKLRILDMEKANIVSGGGAYYITYETSENIIGDQMFYNMNRLTSVVLPETVTYISYWAFGNCVNLEKVKLPEKLTDLNAGLIFNNCIKLVSIEIPEGTTTIGSSTFDGCKSLESITIPASVADIGGSAFFSCSSLKRIDLSGVKRIQNYAFSDCTSLTEITFSSELVSIEGGAFNGCTSLTNIVLPDGISQLSSNTFYGCTKLTTIKLPKNLVVIENNAFYGCSSLTNLQIPQNVGVINEYAFNECSSLASVELPAGLGILGEYAFEGCSKLESIIIPENVVEIQNNTFSGCTSLTSVSLPLELQSIGNSAFSNCSKLSSITLPERINKIGDGAFTGCSSLKKIELPNTLLSIRGFNESGLESITIPPSITTIEGGTFNGCKSLASVTLSEGLTTIGDYAFGGCTALKNINIPSTVDSLGQAAFVQSGLVEITVPEKITKLYGSTFRECKNLKTVHLPNTLKQLYGTDDNMTTDQYGSFQDCSSLESINFPKGLLYIGKGSFSGCSKLTSIQLPEGVTTVNDYAFRNCSAVTFIQVPMSVTTIGDQAFGCKTNNNYQSLEYIVWNTSLPIQKKYFRNEWSDYSRINYLYLTASGQIAQDFDIADYIIRDGMIDALYCNSETYISGGQGTGGALPTDAPLPFKTKKITFNDYYGMRSGNGSIGGWQTIVLPFTPKNIEHETKGVIAPFGSDIANAKHFWLYEVTATGFTKATQIEAGKPYIISMPYNDAYPEASNLNGRVTFTAEDAAGIEIYNAESKLQRSESTEFSFVPTYKSLAQHDSIYSLNISYNEWEGNYGEYPAGSAFVKNLRAIQPFQAYLITKATAAKAPMLYSIGGGDGNITGIEDPILTPDEATKAYCKDGVLYIQSNKERKIYIYDVTGRTVRILEAQEGENQINDLENGIYFLEGHKVVVQ